ncbi:MAG: type II toxin-antitoxin system HicA family toxin [Pseudomonadota bacterium]
MKKRDLERILRGLGWRLLRQGGSHEIWTNGTETESIPRHVEVNEMVARAILKRVRKHHES